MEQEERHIGDLPGAVISEVDRKMDEVYGDHVHQNPGTHLDGGISDDKKWQEYWSRLVVYPTQTYDSPSGSVGRRFTSLLADEFDGILSRKCNSERPLVFSMVILQRTRNVRKSKDIKSRISKRLDAWEQGKFDMLVQETERDMKSLLSDKQRGTTFEQRAKIFHQKMLRGDVRGAVRYLTEREKGGVFMPDEIDEKTGDTVEEVLQSKHPDARNVDPSFLPEYEEIPDFVDLDITEEVVEKVARKLSGSGGLCGSDAQAASQLLLKFGKASHKLRTVMAKLALWLANDTPPWAAYRALMAGRLLALDKCPGIRPIVSGEIWRRTLAKIILEVAGGAAKDACGTDQLCAGLEAGIEGGIHAMKLMWDIHHMEEEWGFLLIDARNAFNELNRTAMLWTVRHEWPAGARFAFNCYKHWPTLVIRGSNGTGVFLFSKEGSTQGDPLSMIVYGIGTLPLVRQLKQEFPAVEQTWYADDGGAGGRFDSIRKQFTRLQEIGPNFGYFPEPTKSMLIIPNHSLEVAKVEFADLGFKVTTGHRYLGGFIGEKEALQEWIEELTKNWSQAVADLASVAKAYPQTTYAGLQKSLQQEWQFVQRVVENIGDNFTNVAEAISQLFLPALFNDELEDGDPRHLLAGLPVKHAGLAIPNPTQSAEKNFEASTLITSHLTAALRGVEVFRSAAHASVVSRVKAELKERNKVFNDSKLNQIASQLPCDDRRTILRGKDTGQWLSVLPSTVNGTELSAQEFRDSLCLRYARTPGDLPKSCDGCGQKFSIRHALECKKGGLVICRHNEVRDELSDLAVKAFIPSAVRDEPRIHIGRPAEESKEQTETNPAVTRNFLKNRGEDRGDLLIRGLWARGTDCILDIRVTDTDAKSNRSKDPGKVLAAHEREKKKKYLQPCLEQRRHFTPFVTSTDGLIGKEGKTVLKRLSALIAEKWDKPYSEVCGYVNAKMSIAIVRATHLCLRGSRVPTSQMSNRRPEWEDQAGLSLFRH